MWQFNVEILQWMNALTQYSFIRSICPILADLPIFFLPLFLSGMWIYYSVKKYPLKENLLILFYSSVVAHFISVTIQQFVHFDRPEDAITNKSALILEHIPDASFPSDHASVGIAFLTGLYLAGYKKTFWAFFPWVILMCLSRIIVGVHWPYDILAGVIVGVISALIAFRFLKKSTWVQTGNKKIISLLSYIKL